MLIWLFLFRSKGLVNSSMKNLKFDQNKCLFLYIEKLKLCNSRFFSNITNAPTKNARLVTLGKTALLEVSCCLVLQVRKKNDEALISAVEATNRCPMQACHNTQHATIQSMSKSSEIKAALTWIFGEHRKRFQYIFKGAGCSSTSQWISCIGFLVRFKPPQEKVTCIKLKWGQTQSTRVSTAKFSTVKQHQIVRGY